MVLGAIMKQYILTNIHGLDRLLAELKLDIEAGHSCKHNIYRGFIMTRKQTLEKQKEAMVYLGNGIVLDDIFKRFMTESYKATLNKRLKAGFVDRGCLDKLFQDTTEDFISWLHEDRAVVVPITYFYKLNLKELKTHGITLKDFREFAWFSSPDAIKQSVYDNMLRIERVKRVYISILKQEKELTGCKFRVIQGQGA